MVEVCKGCKNVMDKSEAAFRCLSCGCVMHLNQCSGLAKNLVKAIQELGSNILLLCNQCVDAGRRDVIVEREASARKEETTEAKFDLVSSQLTAIKESIASIEWPIDRQLNAIKESIADLKKKSIVNNSLPAERSTSPETKADTNLEIRISGLEEYKPKPNENISSAIINFETQQVEEVFNFLGEEKPDIKNIRRLGKRNTATDRPRTMILTLSNPWAVRKIISKAPLLKNFKPEIANKIFISKSLTKDEQLKEKACLQKRWKLITEDGVNRKNISIRNFEVYVNGTKVEM